MKRAQNDEKRNPQDKDHRRQRSHTNLESIIGKETCDEHFNDKEDGRSFVVGQ